jgi:hypothetical protein
MATGRHAMSIRIVAQLFVVFPLQYSDTLQLIKADAAEFYCGIGLGLRE